MPKRFSKPIVIEPAQSIDRLDITAYHVDAVNRTIVCDVTATNESTGAAVVFPRPPLVLQEHDVTIAMSEAATSIATAAVRAALGDRTADQLNAAMRAQPDAAALLYYNATRDALYARF
jgi:hypothetical protein